jgi:prepilin-type N-terminal cleavage/methylation domain-containing protein
MKLKMQHRESKMRGSQQAGFSLLELLIAMTVTLAVMVAASTLLATSLRTRARENVRSNALASVQRALSMMSREISNSGYGLADNGIVTADSTASSIRMRANLDNNTNLNGIDEDVRFVMQAATTNNEIVRYDNSTAASARSVLATNITSFTIKYLNLAGTEVSAATAERVSIEVEVLLPASPEEPAGVVNLISQVSLRNAPLTLQQF